MFGADAVSYYLYKHIYDIGVGRGGGGGGGAGPPNNFGGGGGATYPLAPQ